MNTLDRPDADLAFANEDDTAVKKEIFALGLRNPFRFTLAPITVLGRSLSARVIGGHVFRGIPG